MYLRLWWKDARQFWPIWAFLAVAAIVTQGLVLHYVGDEARRGILGGLALCWTALYALSVGAAAFAAERETGTLRFLDILPASRRLVWAGKVSFAFASTLALAASLLAIAAIGSDRWGMGWRIGSLADVIPIIGLVPIALISALFCSSLMSNALLAALAAIGLTTFSWMALLAGLEARLDQTGHRSWDGLRDQLTYDIAGMLAALVASCFAFTWSRRNRRVPLRVRFRSPIAMSWDGPARVRLAPEQSQPAIAPESVGVAAEPAPISFAAAAGPWTADRPRPRSWFTEHRYLAWQAMREGFRTWCFLMAFGLILPIAYYVTVIVLMLPHPEPVFALPINAVVALVAGVSVFGLESQRRTYRFLVHHGARPGAVWLTKLGVWCFAMAIIWVPVIVMSLEVLPSDQTRETILWSVYSLPLTFAVAQLCGMVFPRGITAAVIALVVTLALGAGQAALITWGKMMPVWGLAVLPVAFLVVTRAWVGDWLLDRPAPGRYLRLGLILAGTLGVILAGYAGERAWSIPDPGPIAAPSTWMTMASLSPDRNAAELYREAARKLAEVPPGTDFSRGTPERRDVLALIRQAAARPDCRFVEPDRLTLLSRYDLAPMRDLAGLVADHARERLRRGELADGWDDIALLLRMARHLSQGATMFQGLHALTIEREALDLARDWSTAPRQTLDRLRAAMVAYRDLPRPIPAAEVVRGEAILLERTIDLPADDLKGLLLETTVGPRNLANGTIPTWALLYLDLITTPWERARAVRVNRQFAAYLAREAALEPWQQQLGPWLPMAYDLMSSPLARSLEANTGACLDSEARNEVARRALVQVMAIRAWQLRHDGRFPDRLEALVPEELPGLPVNPYSGRTYSYEPDVTKSNLMMEHLIQEAGAVLYSIGPKGSRSGDIIFAIPPLVRPGATGGQAAEPAKAKESTKPAPAKPPGSSGR